MLLNDYYVYLANLLLTLLKKELRLKYIIFYHVNPYIFFRGYNIIFAYFIPWIIISFI